MERKVYNAMGLMSGTSLDGIDVAILRTDGVKIYEFGDSAFRPYSHDERAILEQAIQDALQWQFVGPRPDIFGEAQDILLEAHIEAVGLLGTTDIDFIGFHGQTVLHHPPMQGQNGQTLQLGDGQALASTLGVDVVWDFRSRDMELGGHGAPLAPIYHAALLARNDYNHSVGVLNIGGVSNITIIDKKETLHASDCGPGNGPIDSFMARHGLGAYDDGGRLALSGTPQIGLVESWLNAKFFTYPTPKSADRYDFDVLEDLKGIKPSDATATLALYCAYGVHKTLKTITQDIDLLIICGGGRQNRAIMSALEQITGSEIINADTLDWNGDALEAQAFAYLAARRINNLPVSFPATTGCLRPTIGGLVAKADKSYTSPII